MPHIQRALQLGEQFSGIVTEQHAALDALDRMDMGILLVSREGRILHANARAEASLRENAGLRQIAGRLVAVDLRLNDRLSRAIQEATDTAAGRSAVAGDALAIKRENRLPLVLSIAPLRPARDGFGAPQPAAMIMIRDPETPTLAARGLQSRFGLTPAEAVIARALADGKSLADIALAQAISRHTARSHLKSILAKTGTHRQAQLVAALLRGAQE